MRRLAVFARSPAPGRVKSRLSPALPERLAAALYAGLLADAFAAASAAAVLDMQQHAPPPDLRKLRRDVPRALSDAVMKALAKPREDRWQTAAEMRQALLPYVLAS